MKRILFMGIFLLLAASPPVFAQTNVKQPIKIESVKTQCQATIIGGHQCTRKTVTGSNFCKQHDPATVHCIAKNKNGQPCGSLPMKGSKWCKAHQSLSDGSGVRFRQEDAKSSKS